MVSAGARRHKVREGARDDVEFATNYGLNQPEDSGVVKIWFVECTRGGTYGARCNAYRADSARIRDRDACDGFGARRNADHDCGG
jgi:hypothetical protein